MNKRHRTPSAQKKARAGRKRYYPDNDPEWERLEERYSTFVGDEMRRLAEILRG